MYIRTVLTSKDNRCFLTVALAEAAAAEVNPADLLQAAAEVTAAEGVEEQVPASEVAADPLSLPPLPPPAIQSLKSMLKEQLAVFSEPGSYQLEPGSTFITITLSSKNISHCT